MNVSMNLADAAQVADGKLMMIGGNWNVWNGKGPTAIALTIEVEWHETNQKHRMKLQLLDTDGREVFTDNGGVLSPVLLTAELEYGRPPGLQPGASQTYSSTIAIGSITLKPGMRYVWQCLINESLQAERGFFCPAQPAS